MNRYVLSDLIFLSLIALFMYAVFSQLYDVTSFRQHMQNQPFTIQFASALAWAIPCAEILTVALLSINRLRLLGMLLAFGLLFLFTAYIVLILFNFFDQIPCSCGGILPHKSWGANLIFNLSFLVLASIGVWFERKRSPIKKRSSK